MVNQTDYIVGNDRNIPIFGVCDGAVLPCLCVWRADRAGYQRAGKYGYGVDKGEKGWKPADKGQLNTAVWF